MSSIRVKICGITQPEDARAAAEAGASAIGLVFYPPSRRNVTPEQACRVVHALPPFVNAVGLFLEPTQNEVARVLEQVPLDVLQFHGRETGEFCRSFGRPYIKAVAMTDNRGSAMTAHADYPDARGLLFDSHEPGAAGGSGKTFAWDSLPAQRDFFLILAGGLTPANVGRAIRAVRPDAVDVSSGVESAPGRKDATRMQKFIEEVRSGDHHPEPIID